MKTILYTLALFSFIANSQCIKGDCQNGKGTYKYVNGGTFVGMFKNGDEFKGVFTNIFPSGPIVFDGYFIDTENGPTLDSTKKGKMIHYANIEKEGFITQVVENNMISWKLNGVGEKKSLSNSGGFFIEKGNFINDILEINRLESNKVSVEELSFNIAELVESIKVSLNEFIEENNITFHKDIDTSINYNLIGDTTKVSQILINLISNAIKFSKNGDVWVTIKKTFETNNEVVVFFEIKDNGIGIPLDKQDTIFESFSQGSVEINRTFGGTGLGLSIVKKILQILNSQIILKSDGKSGTSFSFSLNFKKAQLVTDNNSNIKKIIPVDISNKKILLVEDNKINQMITQKMLEKKNVSCVIIDNGEDAIDNVRENEYDLILMDIHLPGINGTEATAEIRKFNTTIPIIALTAISLNENREMLLSYGMNEVITKPFMPEKFFEIVTSYLINKK